MTNDTDSIKLKLLKSMTLIEAKEFYDSAIELLANTKAEKIWIDAVENEVIELPVLQILACVVRKAEETGAKVIWDNPSIALFEKSVELGMDGALGI